MMEGMLNGGREGGRRKASGCRGNALGRKSKERGIEGGRGEG